MMTRLRWLSWIFILRMTATLVIPKKHHPTIYEVLDEEVARIYKVAKKSHAL